MKTPILSLSGLILCLVSCGHSSKPAAVKQYSLTGKVAAIDAKEHTAAVDADAIPGYMDAMKMDYPIASASDLASLRVGENISATINVGADGTYSLSDIHERSVPGKGK